MSHQLFWFDGSRSYGSPFAAFGDSITGSGWADPAATDAADVGNEEVVNGTSLSQSSSNLLTFQPAVETTSQLPSLPASPKVNNNGGKSTSKKSEVGTTVVDVNGSTGRPPRLSEDLYLGADALNLTNLESLSGSPKVNVSSYEEGSGRYQYGGLLSLTAPLSDDGYRSDSDRLPFLSNGTAKPGEAGRGSTSALSSLAGNACLPADRSGNATPTASLTSAPDSSSLPQVKTSTYVPSNDGISSTGNSAEGPRRGSARRAPQPPSSAATRTSFDAQGGRSPLYGNGPQLPPHPTPTNSGRMSERRGSQSELSAGKESAGSLTASKRRWKDKDSQQHLNGSRSTAPGSRATTFVGLNDSPHASHTHAAYAARGTSQTGKTNSNSNSNTHGLKARRGEAPSSARSASSASSRTQSDGDLRSRRTSSRNAEHGNSPGSAGGGGYGSSPEGRNRSASEPSPMKDEENPYYPFGLAEMPTRTQDQSHVQGVVEVGAGTSSRLGNCGKTQPQPTSRKSDAGNSPAAPGTLPVAAQEPYDLSFIGEFNNEDDDKETWGTPFDFGVVAQPPAAPLSRPPQTSLTSSSTLAKTVTAAQALQPARRKSAPTLSGFQPVPASASTTDASAAGHASLHSAPPRLEKKHSIFEPVPMRTSAMSASGRRFTFDGRKSSSPTSLSTPSSEAKSFSAEKSGAVPSPVVAEPKPEMSLSLSRSAASRAPRPPSRHTVSRADAMGDVVEVVANTLPALSTRKPQTSEKNAPVERTSREATPTTASVSSTPPVSKVTPSGIHGKDCSSCSGKTTLPSLVPASLRQPARPLAATAVSSSSSSSSSSGPPATVKPTPPNLALLPPSPSHSRLIKVSNNSKENQKSHNNNNNDSTDAPLSPIASDADSVGSVGAAEQTALTNNALRKVHSSVLIRTKVKETDLVPSLNEPWPLQPPPAGIMIQLRVFDPQHPRPRGKRMRELPEGKRQANWTPPVTHYTTTLADLAAYEEEEEEANAPGAYGGVAQPREKAELRAIEDTTDDVWAMKDAELNRPSSTVKAPFSTTTTTAATATAAPASLPPPLPSATSSVQRSTTIPCVSTPSSDSTARRSADMAPTSASHTPSAEKGSAQKLNTPVALGITPLSSGAVHSTPSSFSPYPDAPHLAMDGSLSTSFTRSKRYGGIVVDEVEKVRRMREDSVFTPVLDNLDSAAPCMTATMAGQTSPPANERPGSAKQPSYTPHSDAVSVIPSRTKFPVLVPGGLSLHPSSPRVGDAADTSCTSRTAGENNSVFDSHNNNSHHHSIRNDSLFFDESGNPVLPQSPSMPTFARIIAQRSGGYERVPRGLPGDGGQSGSRDSLFSDVGGMTGGLGSFGDRKSVVTFADEKPKSDSPRRC